METVGGTATESVRLPPPWLRGGNVVPRIKSDDPYLQIVQPEGISEGGEEGERGSGGTTEVTSAPQEAPLGNQRGVHTTARGTNPSPERASVPGASEASANVATWLENREDIHHCCLMFRIQNIETPWFRVFRPQSLMLNKLNKTSTCIFPSIL